MQELVRGKVLKYKLAVFEIHNCRFVNLIEIICPTPIFYQSPWRCGDNLTF